MKLFVMQDFLQACRDGTWGISTALPLPAAQIQGRRGGSVFRLTPTRIYRLEQIYHVYYFLKS